MRVCRETETALNLLVTGRPGSGKTTVIGRIIALLPFDTATGFVTREVREGGVRRGFAIQTLDGRTAPLACVGGGEPRVGGFIAEVRRRSDVRIMEVTVRNRDDLPATIVATLGFDAGGRDER